MRKLVKAFLVLLLFWYLPFTPPFALTSVAQGQQQLFTVTITGTTSITGADQSYALNIHTLTLVVDVTTITGTAPTITPVLQMKDPVSGKYIQWHSAFTAIAATGTFTYIWTTGGGAAAGGITAVSGFPAPYPTWRVLLTYGGTVTATAGTATVYGSP